MQLYIGIMSGTSLDGIDVALCKFEANEYEVIATHFLPYPAELKCSLLALHTPHTNELETTLLLGNQLAQLYADAVKKMLVATKVNANKIVAIGCHGQTIRHRPELGFTVQIGNNALLSELTNITVVGDFRSRDIAAGGQGAPLVPAFHKAIFGSNTVNRAIINIGGIANITYLNKNGDVLGFDSGPGNMLLDAWAKLKLDQDFDADGAWAASGVVHESFLSNMLAEPYFALLPPKSTGRDLFNDAWLKQHTLYPHTRPQDIARTLVELSAYTICQALSRFCADVDEVYLCGGGARNGLLVGTIKTMLAGTPVMNTDALGVGVDWLEAVAFAWLAKQTIEGKPSNLPAVTGAKGLRVLGAIYLA
jgi:anhydro-N-acetylmuramic acid kinase